MYNSEYWKKVFSCGCTRCHLQQAKYYNKPIEDILPDVNYECKVSGINYYKGENEVDNANKDIAVEAAEDVANTIHDPSMVNIVQDLECAYQLLAKFREEIAALHPSVSNIFKALF